ncbi:PEP/pyruvate-binding domain-containing protein [Anaerocolumna aminovalerica]|uniref:PEP/pyruvate-binding domain-containing protein n=1 Tax=Anaerocolumna aminovalerica TaxID=1527 RepID=UPI000BE43BE1|nr:PEP/pyruvate-binding domain-containing protein [Anaerocolumna aminovalerica]
MNLFGEDYDQYVQINYRCVDTMLSVNFIYDLYDQYDADVNFYRYKNVKIYYKDKKMWSYTPKKDWDLVRIELAKKFLTTDTDLIHKIEAYCKRDKEELYRFLPTIDPQYLQSLTLYELSELITKWYYLTLNQIYLINLAPIENGIFHAIDELASKEKISQEELSVLLSLEEMTEIQTENLTFLNMIYNHGLDNLEDKSLHEHYIRYKHLSIGYGSKEMSKEVFFSRYKNYCEKGKEYIKEQIEEISNYPDNIKQKKQSIEVRIKNKKLLILLHCATRLGQLRDKNKALLGKSVEYRNLILKEIVTRTKVPKEELQFYLLDEIIQFLKGEVRLSYKEIARRKEGVLLASVATLHTGTAANEAYYKGNLQEKNTLDVSKAKGVCASPGRVEGIARIITNASDCEKFQEEDDILITHGTDFDFMNVMIKAKGIITEEGGILSHASVVSREMKKPCIISFDHITNLIHTGDYIVMDATKGTVEILKCITNEKKKNEVQEIFTLESTVMKASSVGNKAYNLWLLRQYGFQVPESMFISREFFLQLLQKQQLLSAYQQYLRDGDYTSIKDLLDQLSIPVEVILSHLNTNSNIYAIRSSSPNEDCKTLSFAGQYATYLFRKSISEITESIKNVLKSYYEFNLEYVGAFDSFQGDDNMGGVILQNMILADYAGVLFTKHPVEKKSDCLVIECCKGVGNKLVDHNVKPSRYIVNRTNIENVELESECDYLTKEAIHQLSRTGLEIKRKFGVELDIEWALKGSELFILQCRPITN